MNLAISNLLLFSLSFGVAEVRWLKKTITITEKSFQTGGNPNGRLQLNSHPKAQFLITISTTQEIRREVSNHVSLNNGLIL